MIHCFQLGTGFHSGCQSQPIILTRKQRNTEPQNVETTPTGLLNNGVDRKKVQNLLLQTTNVPIMFLSYTVSDIIIIIIIIITAIVIVTVIARKKRR